MIAAADLVCDVRYPFHVGAAAFFGDIEYTFDINAADPIANVGIPS